MKFCFFKKVKPLLVFMLVFLLSHIGLSQGIIRGKIIDAETGEELIGATAMIQGTTLGSATDLDGNFSILNIPAGVYNVVCQYISYQPQTIEKVEVKNNEVILINVQLQTVSLGLDEVVIAAKMEQRTEAALLTVQKKSANVIDGISAQQMSRSGDSDAAGALKRVTGVNVEDGKYVYVRGLGDRYSKTTLNGADLPGLDPNRNTVQMDIFPANLIDNIVVFKSFSPELPADFTGGLINIVTKDFPEQYTLHFDLKLGYNTQASFNPDFLGYKGSSTDFLGYGNSFRSLPSDAANIPAYPSNRAQLTSITESFNKIMGPEATPSLMNMSLAFSIGNQTNVGKKQNQLGYLFGLSYKVANDFYQDGEKGLYKLGGAGNSTLTKLHQYNDNQGVKGVLWGAVGNLSYKFSNTNKISVNLFKNQSGESGARYMYGQKPSDDLGDLIIETRKLQWLQRSLNSGQIDGAHFVEKLSNMKIEWLGSVTASKQDEPDMRFFTNSYYPSLEAPYNYSIEPSIYQVPSRFYRYLSEVNYFIKTDFTLDAGKSAQTPKIKFGGLYSYKDRDFDETRINYQFQFAPTTYNGSVADFVADSMIGTNYAGYNPNTGSNFGLYVQGVPIDDLKNSYTASQTIGAAYAMIDALVAKKLRISGGARYEYTQIYSSSKDTTLAEGKLNNNDILPAVNLTWMVTNKINLRFDYSRTLARPTFRELAPYASEDFAGGEVFIGNAELRRTLIDNFDLRWENYFASGEMISVGAFIKLFYDPIETVDNPAAQNPELSWQNVDQANLFGAEFDFRKDLGFIRPLKNFKMGLNFTYIYSEVSIDSAELAAIKATEPNAKDTRPMFGQSPYIINAYLLYNNAEIGLDVNLAYNVSGPKIVINVKGGTPDVMAQPYNSINLTAVKRVGEKFQVLLTAKNLVNQNYQETYTYNDTEYIYSKFKAGIVIEAGFKFNIN